MDNMWWNRVPNSVRFINDIVAAFSEGSSVVCVIPETSEWEWTMRTIIKEKIYSGVDKTHELSGKDMGATSPGECLIKLFFDEEDPRIAGFRTSIGYETFLTKTENESGMIHSYVYLNELNEKQTCDWIEFINVYNKQHKPKAQKCKFIIETRVSMVEEKKGIRVIRRSEYLHNNDIAILCMMAISSMPLQDSFREYFTELATLCAQCDPELAAELISTGEEFIQNTHAVVDMIVSERLRSDLGVFRRVDDLERIIWKAQLKVFFPLIERYRLDLIKKYECDFPIHESITNMIGEEIESVYDIELNTIKDLCDKGKLYLPRPDFEEMKFFKQCRNVLAHLKPLPFESLKRIAAAANNV